MADVIPFPVVAETDRSWPGVRPTDAEDRLRALDTRRSAIVEAPAGSGKTGLLMQRFLKLLAEESVTQPEEVLALTFTNKAAGEMRQRVLEQLHGAHEGEPLADDSPFFAETRGLAQRVLRRDAELGWHLLDRPKRLNLRTIDSICAEIAGALPLVSGSGALHQPTTQAAPLYLAAAGRTLAQLGGPDLELTAALRTVLLHRDANLRNVETLLARMLETREQWGELVPLRPGPMDDAELDREVRPRLERILEDIVCRTLTRAANALPAGLLEELAAIAADFGELPPHAVQEHPFAVCAGKPGPPEAVAEHLDQWVAIISLLIKPSDGAWRKAIHKGVLNVDPEKRTIERLKMLIVSVQQDDLKEALCAVVALPPARYPDDQWAVARALFRVLRHALAELRLLFAERSECDFTEMALAARQALRTDEAASDLALTYGGRLRHLLVDEMQDTSAGQYELIQMLTRSFDGHSQTLFLVGDPKQSIYLFRHARVERFLEALQHGRLGDIPLDVLRLTTNFRSQTALVENVNETFREVFPDAKPGAPGAGQITFVAATPDRPGTPHTAGIVWHPTILAARTSSTTAQSGPQESEEEAEATQDTSAAQARALRAVVDQWRARPLPSGRVKAWRIAVLASARNHFAPILAEFKTDRGQGTVAYRAVDIDRLSRQPEVLDALALTRALLHPADRVAWLAVLRSPWIGLTLADLLTLTGEGVDPRNAPQAVKTMLTLVSERRAHLSSDGRRRLDRAWPLLETAWKTFGSSPLALHVERTWRSLGGDLPLTPLALDNVRRYFALVDEWAGSGNAPELRTLETRLEQLFAEPAPAEGAVELMTLHKAKGLEWDVVLVPSLERMSGSNHKPLLNWLEFDAPGKHESALLLAPIEPFGEETGCLNVWLDAMRSRRELAERKRVFYVASTRAREQLHLFAAARLNKTGDSFCQPAKGSLLQASWPAAERIFQQELRKAAESEPLIEALRRSLAGEEETDALDASRGLALAASAEAPSLRLERLPAALDPTARFLQAAASRLEYLPAASLPAAPTFDRPEGSFAVRAFGNVVHRFLQRIAELAQIGRPLNEVSREIPSWMPRLAASLRGEGLSPAAAQQDASRALRALSAALSDPVGRWILAPHPQAASEQEVTLARGPDSPRTLRADRVLTTSTVPPGVILPSVAQRTWIVDFKTAEQGSRSDAHFEHEQRERYGRQLDSYAAALSPALKGAEVLRALYFPLAGRFFWWDGSCVRPSNREGA